MSILAELARAERIRAMAFRESSLNKHHAGPNSDILSAMAFAFEISAQKMDAVVKADFAREIADGAV